MSIEGDILDSTLRRVSDDLDLNNDIINALRKELSTGEKPDVEKLGSILHRQGMVIQE